RRSPRAGSPGSCPAGSISGAAGRDAHSSAPRRGAPARSGLWSHRSGSPAWSPPARRQARRWCRGDHALRSQASGSWSAQAAARSSVRGFGSLPRQLFGLQFLLGKLAVHRLGHRVAKLDLARHLDLGDLRLKVALDVIDTRAGTLLELDERLGRLAAVLVLDADHGHLFDRGMLINRLLDAARVDVVTRTDDQILDAV